MNIGKVVKIGEREPIAIPLPLPSPEPAPQKREPARREPAKTPA